MSETFILILVFFLGTLIGGFVVYFLLRKQRHGALPGIASHVEKQKTEKQTRKERILLMIRERGSVTNNDIEKALGVSDASATNYLQELEREGKIERIGERGRFVSYKLKK